MNLFNEIVEVVKSYDVSVEVKEDELVIINQLNDNRLLVYEDVYYNKELTTRFVSYCVVFSTQHRHFDDIEDVDDIKKYVLSILNDDVLPIEFYSKGERRFGGELSRSEYQSLTLSKLSERFGYISDYLSQFEYEIHSWSGDYDTGRKSVSDLSNTI